MDKYLPIGSVVLLEGGTKRVMIYGRKQQELNTNKIWDYIACLYPEGNINEQYMYLFNHDQIDKIYFIGYQDEEEFEFVKENLFEND
ncbi:DUF4176 domain-containing protein [Neobacillus sp. MM2021_6]|uniref:DUF4176 domain-containing protein n=1 Tax=Bacillaceae TaxID=186817 RepID=UPI00140A95F6|nr:MULTISPECIES: DUF4176 domain-containing protein [Bacillaceae]MBO0958730.1 DUF4176 domain-containing protein [Neobacillus sp. MM2021_6]NHC18176.1 DUF4176 domain-containing protein [Bacillus sp. MM2020_4]